MKNFKVATFIKTILLVLLVTSTHTSFAESITLEEEKEILQRIDEKSKKKWHPLISNQENRQWVDEQTQLGLYGIVYQKGWFSPRVARQIVPDLKSGFLLVDTITIGDKLLSQLTTLTSNLLLSYYFPYVQGGRISSKTFTNVKHFKTYEEALLTKNFELKKIPFNAKDFEQIENGEIISTMTSSGFFTRFSAGLFDMLQLDVPALLELGPKVKLQMKHTLKLSISKENDTTAIISIEKIDENLKGVGIGLGVYIEELITLPVSVGIDGYDGYSPLVINKKHTKKKTQSLVYKLDLTDARAQKAYDSFLKKDFTVLQDLSLEKDSPVTLDIVKKGDISISESNFAINLLIFRTGERNIYVDGKFNTTLSNGNKFSYEEVTRKRVRDRSGFSGDEKDVLIFSTIVPLDGDNPDSFSKEEKASFVLDTHYYYEDSKTKGKELTEVSKTISLLGIPAGLPVIFDEKKNYGKVQVEAKIRFSAPAIKDILDSEKEELWISLASSFGLSNIFSWRDESARNAYKKTNYVPSFMRSNRHNNGSRRPSKAQKVKMKKLVALKNANEIIKRFNNIQEEDSLSKKSKSLLKLLHSKTYGKFLHKTMVDIVGLDQIMGRGHIRGRNF
jgi:hypothetical protein